LPLEGEIDRRIADSQVVKRDCADRAARIFTMVVGHRFGGGE